LAWVAGYVQRWYSCKTNQVVVDVHNAITARPKHQLKNEVA